jgi:zinc protease
MIDRTITPEIKEISELSFVQAKIYQISPNLSLHLMDAVPNDTARLELFFDAGIARGDKGTSSFVSGMLFSGNKDLSSNEIHHQLDYLGAFHESGLSSENSVLGFYALRENFPELIKVIKKAFNGMTVEDDELNEMIADKKQNFQVNMQKTRFLAQREFQKRLFSTAPEYGQVAEEEFYENVDRKELIRFFQKNYLKGLNKISLVGAFDEEFIQMVINTFKDWAIDEKPQFISEVQNEIGQFNIEKDDAMQSAIRIGKILFNKKHEDFIDFQILNTVLGDYFGSRLMSNIREDKGYTYGIGSLMAEYRDFGYFMIATEVAKEFKEATLIEVEKEIKILQTELVAEEELGLIKNYLLGQMLKGADGPYSMIDMHLAVELHDKNFDYYNDVLSSIRNITPERIRELAQKHLNWDEMTIVTAG